MAVQSAAGRTVPLFVLIIFIVLFLLALTGLVLLFVHQETVRQQAQQDRSFYETYVGSGLNTRLDPYKAMGGSFRPAKTAVGALLDERDQLAVLLTGNKASTPKEATDKLQKTITTLPPESSAVQKLGTIAKADLIGAFQQGVLLIKNQTDEMTALQAQLAECQKSRDTVTAGYKELEEKFKEKTEQFTNQLTELQKLTDSIKKDFSDQLDAIKSQVSKDLQAQMDKRQKQNLERIDELRDLVRRNLASLIASAKELGPAEIRMVAMMTVDQLTQKIDGEVIDLAGPVVYIGLGSKQNVQPGARFCVVAASLQGQVQPKVKAVLEVTKTGDMTAECRIVRSLPGEPIIRGDHLVNLAYDREMSLTFVVLGDFDLAKTGTADPNAARKITEIIQTAGGKVANQLSPTVNFAVMGEPPVAAAPAAGEDAADSKQSQVLRNYNDMKDQIQAMRIPVVTPDLFVLYTGHAQKLSDQ